MELPLLSRRTIVANSIVLSLALLGVGLRIVARKINKIPFWIDDYLIFASMVLAAGTCGTALYAGTTNLYAISFKDKTPEQFTEHMKIEFINVLFWFIALGLIKISVLFFFLRIFHVRKFKLLAYGMAVITAMWSLAASLVHVSRKNPALLWNYEVQYVTGSANHINYEVFSLIVTIMNMVLDVMVLSLPISFIPSLQLKRSKKISLGLVFGSGAFCVVASAIRVYYIYELTAGESLDADTLFVWNSIWGNVEVCCSIVAASLPTLAPLVRFWITGYKKSRSYISGLISSTRNPSRTTVDVDDEGQLKRQAWPSRSQLTVAKMSEESSVHPHNQV